MDNLGRLGNQIHITIKPDEEGFIGRNCPNDNCLGYYKIQIGTGLSGPDSPCYCPYCGYQGDKYTFLTEEQSEYIKSYAFNKITEAIRKDFKTLEFDIRPKAGFGIGISMKLKNGKPYPIKYYREKKLETTLECENCSLRYAIYGKFAFCPDCKTHNSYQVFQNNIELCRKQINLSNTLDSELSRLIIENTLEDIVSTFDGYSREFCKINAPKAKNPKNVLRLSFQNIENARSIISDEYSIDLCDRISDDQWKFIIKGFQKRHLISHRMGVIDQNYIQKTNDPKAVIGRLINTSCEELNMLIDLTTMMANNLNKLLHL